MPCWRSGRTHQFSRTAPDEEHALVCHEQEWKESNERLCWRASRNSQPSEDHSRDTSPTIRLPSKKHLLQLQRFVEDSAAVKGRLNLDLTDSSL
jgi:hypothetical protein